jgi:xanthine/uracil permease
MWRSARGRRPAAPARWLGWFAVVVALVAAIPSHVLGGTLDHIGFVAFAALGHWTLVVSVLLAR